MSTLDAAGFASFFADVHNGRKPFPWQEQLVSTLLEGGEWPDLIDVPTGLGKTSMLDVAVYVLAASSGEPRPVAGAAPRRVFFVVDRRLVVDEAYQHATQLAGTIRDSDADVTREVARGLRSLRGGADGGVGPLVVARMRGGTTWDASWVDRPDQPAVVVGTVDQVGSRLLFRGYATTDYRKPMDAALVGTDSLILVDEAHLAESMLRTVARAHRLDRHRVAQVPRARIVQLTATPDTGPAAFPFDVEAHRADHVAWARLNGAKHLRLASCEAKRKPAALAALAVELLAARRGARALIVCNTVRTARETHSALGDALRKSDLHLPLGPDSVELEPELVIGRCRPLDRDRRVRPLLMRFGVDRDRETGETIDVAVATQTVEVGANLDVDVLVSESAPLPALVQRLGRLNRLGGSSVPAPVAVVVDDGSDDPVYGAARRAAWTFLKERAGVVRELGAGTAGAWPAITASPLALRSLVRDAPPEARAGEPGVTPDLSLPTLRSWTRTSPRPEPDAPVAPYLHGLAADARAVTLFWRDDLFDGDEGSWSRRLAALPFVAAESVEVPFLAARAWLSASAIVEVADTDATGSGSEVPPDRPAASTDRVLIRSGDTWRAVDPGQVAPGHIVAVDAVRGGLDRYGWHPASTAPVPDVRDLASLTTNRERVTLRLDERTAGRILHDGAVDAAAAVAAVVARVFRDPEAEPDQSEPDDEPPERQLSEALSNAMRNRMVRAEYLDIVGRLTAAGTDLELIRVAGVRQALVKVKSEPADQVAGDDGETNSSAGTRPVTLATHHRAVSERTRTICTALGLDGELADLVAFAAEHHDLGKIDVRFQAALTDGNVFMAELLSEPLAKSGIPLYSAAARAARRRSGLPPRFRHEAWSARLAGQLLDSDSRPSWARDLVTHLVAAHHGRGRPLLPPVVDARPESLEYGAAQVRTTSELSVDLTAARRFEQLNDRFGIWGLALLETIVRSADQTCSAEGT